MLPPANRSFDGREWRLNGVTDLVRCLFCSCCSCECPLGKTLRDRVLSKMVSYETYQSARCFPSFCEMNANGVTAESQHLTGAALSAMRRGISRATRLAGCHNSARPDHQLQAVSQRIVIVRLPRSPSANTSVPWALVLVRATRLPFTSIVTRISEGSSTTRCSAAWMDVNS